MTVIIICDQRRIFLIIVISSHGVVTVVMVTVVIVVRAVVLVVSILTIPRYVFPTRVISTAISSAQRISFPPRWSRCRLSVFIFLTSHRLPSRPSTLSLSPSSSIFFPSVIIPPPFPSPCPSIPADAQLSTHQLICSFLPLATSLPITSSPSILFSSSITLPSSLPATLFPPLFTSLHTP